MEAAMLNRIAVVGVPAGDVARAAHFYHDILGLRMLPAGRRHAGPPHFKVGDTFLAVFERKAADGESSTPLIAFQVDDIDAAMALLTARGIAFDGGVRQDDQARWTAFRDSEGNWIELVHFAVPPD
jgi:catechol 2,3-dioxygenase-like lactoylglutathione lyase family enzyme